MKNKNECKNIGGTFWEEMLYILSHKKYAVYMKQYFWSTFILQKMESEKMIFPLHLGVTEAGDGLDGRIKSALGIGTLLSEGLGDTIRVSLTEDPEFEIPAAEKILSKIESMPIKKSNFNNIRAFSYYKRESFEVENIGNKNHPIVISNDESVFEENSPDYIFKLDSSLINKDKKYILPYIEWSKYNLENTFPYYDSVKEFRKWAVPVVVELPTLLRSTRRYP